MWQTATTSCVAGSVSREISTERSNETKRIIICSTQYFIKNLPPLILRRFLLFCRCYLMLTQHHRCHQHHQPYDDETWHAWVYRVSWCDDDDVAHRLYLPHITAESLRTNRAVTKHWHPSPMAVKTAASEMRQEMEYIQWINTYNKNV